MAKRGRKPTDNVIKMNKGTDQPCRNYESVYSGDADDNSKLDIPDWLTDNAKEIWKSKIKIYTSRGQCIVGCEHTLAQYCALEDGLIQLYKKDLAPPVTMISAHRTYANEFYDTPASKLVKASEGNKKNPFLKYGRG